MITDELLPMLAARGLDTDPIGLWGWSLGGFGALLLASNLGPSHVAAVAASSPALWATFSATQPGTFDDEADFEAHDLFARTGSSSTASRCASTAAPTTPSPARCVDCERSSTRPPTAACGPAATTRRSGPARPPRRSSSSASTWREPDG